MRRDSSFHLKDGLLLVAVAAAGLAWSRYSWEAIHHSEGAFTDWSSRRNSELDWPPNVSPWTWWWQTHFYASARALMVSVVYVSTPVVATWGIALLAIDRLRRPRSRIWRARRPGAVACLVATVVLILTFLGHVIRPHVHFSLITFDYPWSRGIRLMTTSWGEYWNEETPFGPDPLVNAVALVPRFAGFVIAGGWTALTLAGAWKPEPTWIDRMGRGLGVFWILAALHFLIFPL